MGHTIYHEVPAYTEHSPGPGYVSATIKTPKARQLFHRTHGWIMAPVEGYFFRDGKMWRTYMPEDIHPLVAGSRFCYPFGTSWRASSIIATAEEVV